jgi:hypothetical protein
VKAPAATPPNCCPQCMGEGWVELKRLCKKHGSGVALPVGPRNGLAQIEGDSIVVRLTADACAFAFANDPHAQEPRPPVIDKQAFLRDTFNALTAEGEDGSTPLTDVLDRAMVKAMEDGSDALDHDAAGVALPAPDLAKKPTVTHLMRLAVAMRHAPSDGYDDAYKCMQNALYAALGVASPINNSSEIPNSSFDAAGVKVLNKEQTMGENHPCPCDLMTGKFDKNCMFHRHLAAQLDADIARLMAAPEAEVEAELRSMGMGPADAARRGHSAVQKALAIFHITRAEIRLQADALHLVRDHLKAAREALRSKPSGVQASGEPGEAGKQLAIKEHREKQARDAGTYTPSREVVQQALELVDRIRDSHASWGGWSGLPATCERITYMLRYGKSPDGVKAPAATPPDCCPQCMGEGWVELKRLCKKHGSGVALDRKASAEPVTKAFIAATEAAQARGRCVSGCAVHKGGGKLCDEACEREKGKSNG